jgi:hypothetical protein
MYSKEKKRKEKKKGFRMNEHFASYITIKRWSYEIDLDRQFFS